MLTVTLPLYLLVIANAALIVAAAFAVLRVDRTLRETRDFWASPTGMAMQVEQAGKPGPDHRRLMQQVLHLQKSVDALGQRAQPLPQEHVIDLALQQAVRMAKRGASVEELSRDCGLNAGEAALLRRLHGRQPTPRAIARSA